MQVAGKITPLRARDNFIQNQLFYTEKFISWLDNPDFTWTWANLASKCFTHAVAAHLLHWVQSSKYIKNYI